jgi:hypothetical protein
MKPEPQRYIFLDAETYYDGEYSLSKMTPVEYILDERFELILMAIKEGVDGKGYIVDGPDFPKWVKDAQPSRELTATVNWNALFDASLVAWRYGYVPGRMLDAMTATRAVLGHTVPNVKLATVAKHLGLPPKGGMVTKMLGVNRQECINRGWWQQECNYALHDNELCAAIWQVVQPQLPWSEQRIQDLVIRAAVQPQLMLDRRRLYNHLTRVRAEKQRLLDACGVDRPDLMSTKKFEALLTSHGVSIEYKQSKSTGKPIPALAKTDDFMQELKDHPTPAVQALAAARLGHKSTQEDTRAVRLLKISMLNWPPASGYCGVNRWMPVPLKYNGAHTERLSGDWGLNEQNMGRGSELRYAHLCGPDEEVIVADLGQIECRLNAWICGQGSLLEAFRNYDAGDKIFDPYNQLGTAIFGRPVNRKLEADKLEGFIGKTGTLGLGFGCGADRFYHMVIELAHLQGLKLGDRWTEDLAKKSVDTYRAAYKQIQNTWYLLGRICDDVWGPNTNRTINFGPVTIGHGMVLGPNGMSMRYGQPRRDMLDDWYYTWGGKRARMYGPKLLENIVQYLARVIVMNASLRLADRGYRFALQSHDELVFVVKKMAVDKAKKIIYEEFVRPPSWAKDLPLAAEVGSGASYGAAK